MARGLAPVLAIFASACAGLVGLSDYAIEPEAAPPGADGGGADVLVLREGGMAEGASPGADSGPPPPFDESTCVPIPTDASVVAHAVDAGAIVVDGRTTDWPCAWRLHFDGTTAGGGVNKELAVATAELGLAWEPTGILFMARLHIPGDHAVVSEDSIYANDGAELYIGRDTPTTGALTTSDVHLIIDYANRAKLYGAVNGDAGTVGIVTAVGPLADGFTVEAYVPSSAMMQPALAAGAVLPFDMQVNERWPTGTERRAFWLYHQPGAGGIGTCASLALRQPSCDSTAWGRLLLSP